MLKPKQWNQEELKQRLAHPLGKIRIVLDTDAFNEIDDQFAIAYALSSPEKLSVEAIYAAPFHNERSVGPGDGMEKSFAEIGRVLQQMDMAMDGRVFRGSTEFLSDLQRPPQSEAVNDLINRAMSSAPENPLYVVALGAITNVASAILQEPRILDRIVVVWLGGHALHWPNTKEFNLRQDVLSARVVFDSGVPFTLIPCMGVTSHLLTTVPEMEANLRDAGKIGLYLIELIRGLEKDRPAFSKVIWDIAPVAYLLDEKCMDTQWVPSPMITDQVTWATDSGRHPIRYVSAIRRDPVFADFFRKLKK